MVFRRRKNAGEGANWFTWRDRIYRQMQPTPFGEVSSIVHYGVKLPCIGALSRADRVTWDLLAVRTSRFP
jgi:hypothetical protein